MGFVSLGSNEFERGYDEVKGDHDSGYRESYWDHGINKRSEVNIGEIKFGTDVLGGLYCCFSKCWFKKEIHFKKLMVIKFCWLI